jgi:L-2-hydroxyglutarate oxidase LhgO
MDEQMKDFSICDSKVHGVEGLINIQGLESPGVTSSLAIGEYVKHMINLKDDPLTYL